MGSANSEQIGGDSGQVNSGTKWNIYLSHFLFLVDTVVIRVSLTCSELLRHCRGGVFVRGTRTRI